jgi:hypothetical protein
LNLPPEWRLLDRKLDRAGLFGLACLNNASRCPDLRDIYEASPDAAANLAVIERAARNVGFEIIYLTDSCTIVSSDTVIDCSLYAVKDDVRLQVFTDPSDRSGTLDTQVDWDIVVILDYEP